MGVKSLPVRAEILETGYDPAPKLGEVLRAIAGEEVSKAAQILANPKEFFERTIVTESMLQVLESVVQGFEGRNRIFLLRSFYGGGKTHTLLAILHAFRDPDSLLLATDIPYDRRVKLEHLARRIKELKAKVVCFSGDTSEFSGDPIKPTNCEGYSYRTVWGYLAHSLGKYGEIKDYDEKLVGPQQDVVEKILRGERVLFLFDELADYLVRFIEDYERYSKVVVNFIELFAKAVYNSNCVAVFTIPIEEGAIDWRYRNVEVIRSLQNALEKVSVSFEPLKGTDVVNVLKKRIFEKIPSALRDIAVQRFKEARVNYPEYFPTVYEKEIEETYPFSPEYVEVLERLVRETGLQKTRAALEITINVVKSVLASKDDPDVFKPWHIKLENFPGAFSKHPEYQQIYKQTIVEPEIDSLVLKTIFLYTYYYDTPIARKEYPGVKEIVRAVYEPEKCSKLNLDIPSIEEIAKKVTDREDVLNIYYSDGKFWFWKLPSIRDYVNKIAARVLSSGDSRIWDHVKRAVEDSYNYIGTRRARITLTHKFKDLVILESFDYPEDEERLRLVVIMDSEIAKTDFPRKVIEYAEEGRERVNKNTIVVLLPHQYGKEPTYSERAKYEKVLKNAAKLVAIEEVSERIQEWYTDVEVTRIQRNLLEREKSNAQQELQNAVIEAYSYVLYPVTGGVHIERISEPSMNIAEGVWRTLRDKVAPKISFDFFAIYVKNRFGIDVERDDAAWTFEQIRKWFKQDPSLPFVADEAIEDVIKDGVKRFRLGVRRGDAIFFKRVHDTMPPAKDSEGLAPSELRENDVVMTRRRAAREQLGVLKSRDGEERATLTHVEVTRYFVYPELGGVKYSVSALENLPDWESVFVNGVIVKEVEKRRVDEPKLEVEVYPAAEIVVKRGEVARFTVVAKPQNFSPEAVNITVTSGGRVMLSEAMTKRDSKFEKELSFEVDRDEEFVAEVNAGKQELSKRLVLRVKVPGLVRRRIETAELNVTHVGAILEKISEVYEIDVLREIANDRQLSSLEGKVNAEILGEESGGRMVLKLEAMPLDVAVHAALELAEYCSERAIRNFEVRFQDLRVDERTIKTFAPLNRRVKYTLFVEVES